MKLPETIEALQRGDTVRRRSWREGEFLQAVNFAAGLPPDFLMLIDPHSRRHWSPSMRDLVADDWVIEPAPPNFGADRRAIKK